MAEVLCFYHASCTDGAASGAVIKKKYPKASLVSVTHGDPVQATVDGKDLFIVDFSFSAEVLADFKRRAKQVHWYDHHITSIPIFEKLKWGIIDLKESGASLTWKQEYPSEPLPKILEYVRDKDLYEWKLPDSREISMYLANQPGINDPESSTWKRLLGPLSESDWEGMIETGKFALRSQKIRILTGLRNGFELDFHGHRALAVNWSLEASDIGEYIYKDLGYTVAVLFYFNGENWTFSLRSNQVDVSQLALQHGGGGHPGAAGFRTDSIDWLLKLRTGKLDPKKISPTM